MTGRPAEGRETATASGVPIAYYLGDDAYTLDRAVDRIAARIANGGEQPGRWRVAGGATSSATIAERVATSPLFGGGTLAVIDDPGPLIRGKDGRAAVDRAIQAVAPGNGLVFVDLLERLPTDRKPLSADRLALQASVLAAGGDAKRVDGPGTGLAGWIEREARERGYRLGRGASTELARRLGGAVRGADVDRRYMGRLAVAELDKLALLHLDGGEIGADDVAELVPEAIPTAPWPFLDAVAERHLGPAVAALDELLGSTPEPVLVSLLHTRLRELLVVADRVAAGATPVELARATKLSGYRLERLVAASRAWTVEELIAALDGVFELDVVVKGSDGTFRGDAARRFAFLAWLVERVGRRPAAGGG